MASIYLDSVSKRYPDGTVAVKDLTLEVKDREFVVLVGPSGSGKSTTLRLIAGLETPDSGEIRLDSQIANELSPRQRDVAMVFQDDALYPHLSVYDNLSFGLVLRYGGGVIARGLKRIFQPVRYRELSSLRRGIDEKVRQAADRLAITGLLDQRPHQLSGGERQRVALGRALVRNPAAFLLDEPLANLDAILRRELRIELKRLHEELKTTILYVTHDQVEAMTLGERVAVMNGGKIVQVGSPLELYQRPANLFVSQFIGNVPMNLLTGTVEQRDEEIEFVNQSLTYRVPLGKPEGCRELIDWISSKNRDTGDTVLSAVAGFRAEHGSLVPATKTADNDESVSRLPQGLMELPGRRIVAIERLGDASVVFVDRNVDGKHDNNGESDFGRHQSHWLAVKVAADANWSIGDIVDVRIEPEKLVWFDATTTNRVR